jgi:glycosyltransferase involved in cell wall biosynthesis
MDAPLVLMIAARLDDWFKGTTLGFDVVRRIQMPNARVLVVGDASPDLRATIPRTAIHLGYLADDAALAHAYRAADVLLMSSLGENFPYVALEALACETPVAAFRVGGLVEIVGENERGVLTEPFDAVELAAAVDALLRDEARRVSYGVQGRRWVEAACDVGRAVEAHLAIYGTAIADFDRLRQAWS